MTDIAPHITAFLRQRLSWSGRRVSIRSDSYAYAFQILFEFASQKLGIRPSALQLEHIDAPLVLAFLEPLHTARGNGPRTRNARLTAIRSFMHVIEYRVPAALDQIRRVLPSAPRRGGVHHEVCN